MKCNLLEDLFVPADGPQVTVLDVITFSAVALEKRHFPLHIIIQFKLLVELFGVTQSPPALSESTVQIHETNHSSASWKQHLTAVVTMGVLPCDHPQQGTREDCLCFLKSPWIILLDKAGGCYA
ncbi:hypothetical protein NQZ68_013317 [Scomber scombrus]|uniref:Uncharacterized protein n=1 Tax=Scomber scombrus TaxID=13677 RepID=A0AAV1N4Z9_SCOSC